MRNAYPVGARFMSSHVRLPVNMKLNWTTAVVGPRVRLQPYRSFHVPKYHGWMADDWIRDMTASERLPLADEHKMQEEWRVDEKKLTFMIFDRAVASSSGPDDLCAGMIGDINLFLLDEDQAEDYVIAADIDASPPDAASGVIAPTHGTRISEIMVMMAEPGSRRQGFAFESLLCMMKYARENLGIQAFVAKISDSNAASIAMFTDKLRFVEVKRLAPFHEIHYVSSAATMELALSEYAVVHHPEDK